MANQILNPEALHPSVRFGFSHVAVATGRKTIYCAGQVAWTADLELVGVDIPTQARQCLASLKIALAAAGATPGDVVRLHTYLVNHTREDLMAVSKELATFYGDALPAPNSVIGVARLAMPEFRIEIEATAVVD
jgi:enamine deaminase RidA (YjgF/YER057c/UK114 family)